MTSKASLLRRHAVWHRLLLGSTAAATLFWAATGTTLAQDAAPAAGQSAVATAAGLALPSIEGPITAPGIMHPSVRGPLTHPFLPEMPAGTNAADLGYLKEEYFISGTTAAGEAYRTRIVVRRPADIAEFSGMVMTEVMHPSSSALIWQASRVGMMLNGHVGVEIDDAPGRIETLKTFNAERYADLAVPEGAANKDIIAQVGRLIKERFPAGEDWSEAIKASVLAGTSATSATALDYMSTHHVSERMDDGSPIFDGLLPAATGLVIPQYDIPIIHNPTQTEATTGSKEGGLPAYRREDSDEPGNQFRQYEVAGMPHLESREAPAFNPTTCDQGRVSSFYYNALSFQMLDHLFNWVAYGETPPRADRIEIDNDTANDGSQLALDEYGNALGGVRNPQLEAPTVTFMVPNSGENRLCALAGYDVPLSPEVTGDLYADADAYAAQLRESAHSLVREGWFPVEYLYELDTEIAAFGQ